MNRNYIVNISFPINKNSHLKEKDLIDYIVNAIEGYSIETGYLAKEFNYEYPRVEIILLDGEPAQNEYL